MIPESSLTALSIIGVLVGVVSALISQLTKTSIDDDGTSKRRLTTPGKWALAVSLIGFAGSFTSEILKAYAAAQQRAQSALEARLKLEREREERQWRARSAALTTAILENTNAALKRAEDNLRSTLDSRQRILADNVVRETRLYGRLSATSAPLTRLTIRLIMRGVPADIRARIGAALAAARDSTSAPDVVEAVERHELDGDDETALVRAITDQQAIQPVISLLASGQFTRQPAVLIVGLDERYSAVVGIGWLNRVSVIARNDDVTYLPAGILIDDEIEWHIGSESTPAFDERARTRPAVNISVNANAVTLTIDLDVNSLNAGILRYSPNAAKTSSFGERIELVTWTLSPDSDITDDDKESKLPLDAAEFHDSIRVMDSFRDPKWVAQQPEWLRRIEIEIIPNDAELIAQSYMLSLSSDGSPVEGPRGDDLTGYVRVWHGQRLQLTK